MPAYVGSMKTTITFISTVEGTRLRALVRQKLNVAVSWRDPPPNGLQIICGRPTTRPAAAGCYQ